MTKYYIVKVGGNLYVSSKMYGLFQETTNSIENATKFATLEQAKQCLSKTIGGEIIPYVMMNEAEYESEKSYMQTTINLLTKQLEEAKLEIKTSEKNEK